MKIISVVGARPQFIKLAPLSKELRKTHNEIIIHTGQHFDKNMSEIFFNQMEIPVPDYDLNITEATHATQTGKMLIALEDVYLKEKPDLVIVFGDTNSTLAGALAASKSHLPVMHIEAGLRSGDMKMPEEQNRIMVDHISDYLSCPCQNALNNLAKEGISKNVFNTGDIMYDAILMFSQKTEALNILDKFKKQYPNIELHNYQLLTIHRASNTDNPDLLKTIFQILEASKQKYIFPIHPRTKKKIKEYNIQLSENIQVIEPIGYLEMLMLIKNAKKIVTDSGGLQKEAMFLKTPCITVRDTTEWMETVETGWNNLVLESSESINQEYFLNLLCAEPLIHNKNITSPYGNGQAAQKINDILKSIHS
ncbi:non-hydrolyzing UDP-N-acetylglucosamine 2-epimerase [Candidatus Margulisiibacteriota bacterium]